MLPRDEPINPRQHGDSGNAEPAGSQKAGTQQRDGDHGRHEDRAENHEQRRDDGEADDGAGENEAGEDEKGAAGGDGGGGFGYLVGPRLGIVLRRRRLEVMRRVVVNDVSHWMRRMRIGRLRRVEN